MRGRVAAASWALVLAALVPGQALAFSDPELFGAPASEGGGAGRFFTGSPADGHACGVCHAGGVAPKVFFDGLPDAGEPGVRHDVTVRWELPELSHAMHLELVNEAGEHPQVELTNAGALPPEERCEGEPDGPAAVYTVDVGARRVLGVQDCGARSLSFSFVAPGGPLRFAAAVVRSNGSATPGGDGVLEVRGVIPSAEGAGGACAFGVPAPGGGRLAGPGALFGVLAVRARRRRRRG